ncbi:MAG: class E sortase [Acidimicrobiales bacterium]
MELRRVMAGIGRTLIALGVLILLFVAYQLWGTGLAEARSQDKLRQDLEGVLPVTPARPSSPPTTAAAPPPAPQGEAVAILRIPKIGVDKAIVEGVGLRDLKKGPGHYPTTPLPGQPGNAAIAGHRTTYGAPFYNLDDLDKGDDILVTTRQGRFRYQVTDKMVVKPSETKVLDATTEARLTLTTCNPRFSASQRLIVVAALQGQAAPAPPPPPRGSPAAARPTTLDDDTDLSGASAANGPALLWGFLAALVAGLTWLASVLWRRWPSYLLGAPVFLVVLFVFFENFSRLLPSNF